MVPSLVSAITGTSTMRGACASMNGTPSRLRSERTASAWNEKSRLAM